MLLTVFVFLGIEGASVYSRYAKKRQDVGRATVLGFLGVLALFASVTILSYGVLPRAGLEKLRQPSMAGAMESVVGVWGTAFISVGVVSVLGAYLAWTLMSAEVLFVAAKDRDMPSFLARTNARKAPAPAVPMTSILIQLALVITLFSQDAFMFTLKLCSLLSLIPYLLAAAYALKLGAGRRNRADDHLGRPCGRRPEQRLPAVPLHFGLPLMVTREPLVPFPARLDGPQGPDTNTENGRRYVSTGHLPSPRQVQGAVDEAYRLYRSETGGENSATYPALAQVPGSLFGICVAGINGSIYRAGDTGHEFTIMSVAKPFVFALVCEMLGPEEVRQKLYCDPAEAVDLYTRQSCLRVSAEDLAVMSATLADGGVNPVTGLRAVTPAVCQHALAVMATAGMYETSGDWLFDVGVPGKSGIGGGIVAVSPGKGGLGTFSPLLDQAGNSVRGQLAARHLSSNARLSLFASKAQRSSPSATEAGC